MKRNKDGTFGKGNKPKGGRSKGTPNKVTSDLRSRVSMLIDRQWDKLDDDFEQLKPNERIQAITNLLEYTLPKLQRTEMTGKDGKKITISFED